MTIITTTTIAAATALLPLREAGVAGTRGRVLPFFMAQCKEGRFCMCILKNCIRFIVCMLGCL